MKKNKCNVCSVELFDCDKVDEDGSFIPFNDSNAYVIKSDTYRCPKCFKCKKVKV